MAESRHGAKHGEKEEKTVPKAILPYPLHGWNSRADLRIVRLRMSKHVYIKLINEYILYIMYIY